MFTSWFQVPLSAALLFVGMLLATEVGFRLGKRHKRAQVNTSPDEATGTGIVDAAIFGLLGLLLAFEFGRTGSRLDLRRQLAVREANAIGTAWLRLEMLPAEPRENLQRQMRQYTDHRIHIWELFPDIEAALAEHAAADRLQGEIWTTAVAGCKTEETSTAMLLLPALNEMIDLSTAIRTATQTHVSALILTLLTSVALICSLLAGLSMSANERRRALHAVLFASATAITVYVILDMDHPRGGLIQVGAADEALLAVRRGMGRVTGK